jgi:hypothetical protein
VVPDSGGPGKFRGGPAHERAVVPHGGGTDDVTAVVIPGAGEEAPGTAGVCGGYPGATSAHRIFRQSNVEELPWSLEVTTSDHVDDARAAALSVGSKDILYLRSEGGGGYGARLTYGVVVDEVNGEVDTDATEQQRRLLREERLGRPVELASMEGQGVARTKYRIGEYLQLTSQDGDVQCTWCGASICSAHDAWRDHAARRTSPVSLAGPPKTVSDDYVLREFFCPSCATALEVQVTRPDEEALHDTISRWP